MINKVKEVRETKNITVLQLAMAAKTSPQAIYAIEKGVMPRRPLRARIAQALNVSMQELFVEAGA